MEITEALDTIINARYGREVRQAIHDGIKQAYEDAISNGHADMEVSQARGSYSTLAERLIADFNKLNSVKISKGKVEASDLMQSVLDIIDQKIAKGQVTMADLTQEVKEVLNGDRPLPIVGKDSVIGYENIVDGTVTPAKTSFLKNGEQLFNMSDSNLEYGVLTENGGVYPNENYKTTHRIYATGEITANYVRAYTIYNSDDSVKENVNTNNNLATVTLTLTAGQYVRYSYHKAYESRVMINLGSTVKPYESYNQFILDSNVRLKASQLIDDVSTNEDAKPFSVKRTGNEIVITSRKDNNQLTQRILLDNSKNGTLNIRETRLNGVLMHNCSDEITPIRLESTVGANHGYTQAVLPVEFHSMLIEGQLFPSVKNIKQDIVEKDDRLIITESYHILDLQSIIAVGTQYASNMESVDTAVIVTVTYEFYGFGKCKISTSLMFHKEKNIGTIGFLQSIPIEGQVTRYIPGLKPIEGFDFKLGVPLADYNINHNVRVADLLYPDEMPAFQVDTNGTFNHTMGYLPIEAGANENRIANSEVKWDLRSTKKSYPMALDWTLNPVKVGSVYQLTGFRNYSLANDMTAFEVIDFGGAFYVYIIANKAIGLNVKQIPEAVGLKVESLISHGITLKSERVGAGGITFSSEPNSYAILKIPK